MKKHTILFLAANPNGTTPLSLDREARAIHVELERSGCRDRFQFETRWAVEPLDLLRELRKVKPTVVHFSGHGSRHVASGRREFLVSELDAHDSEQRYGLYFQGSDGQPQLVSTRAIAETFGAAGMSVKVVVLSACYTVAQADALLAHIDCVVGMDGAILDTAARHFAIGFYGGLAEGESVAVACSQGRAAIRLEERATDDYPQADRRDMTTPNDPLSSQSDADRPRLTVRAGVDASQLVLAARESGNPFQDQRLLEVLRQLVPIITPQANARPDLFREVIEPAFEDLRDVHRDYVNMFQQMQRRIPERREHPQYASRVRVAAEQLRDMRMKGAPVRVELRKLAEHLQSKQLSVQARDFAEALLDYFPDGSLREPRQERDAGWWKTASASLLDQMDEDLSSVKEHDLAGLVHDTIAALEAGWAKACGAFQSLRMAQFI